MTHPIDDCGPVQPGHRISVTRSTFYELLDHETGQPVGGPHEVELAWSATEPGRVQVTFSSSRGAVCWEFDRDMLVAGLCYPVGLGDVSLFPDQDDLSRLELILSSPNGHVTLRLVTRELAEFLHDTGAALDYNLTHGDAGAAGAAGAAAIAPGGSDADPAIDAATEAPTDAVASRDHEIGGR